LNILSATAFLFCSTNCEMRKWDNPLDVNNINLTVTTSLASEVTFNSAILGGNVSSDDGLFHSREQLDNKSKKDIKMNIDPILFIIVTYL